MRTSRRDQFAWIDRIPVGVKVALVIAVVYLMAGQIDAWCLR